MKEYGEKFPCPGCGEIAYRPVRYFRCYTHECNVVLFDLSEIQGGISTETILLNEKRKKSM